MNVNPGVLRAYIEHYLPRDVVGPVLVVFSLEGVIDGIFGLYVPEEYATLGWGLVFLLSLLVVAYLGSTDEEGIEDLEEEIEDIRDDESA